MTDQIPPIASSNPEPTEETAPPKRDYSLVNIGVSTGINHISYSYAEGSYSLEGAAVNSFVRPELALTPNLGIFSLAFGGNGHFTVDSTVDLNNGAYNLDDTQAIDLASDDAMSMTFYGGGIFLRTGFVFHPSKEIDFGFTVNSELQGADWSLNVEEDYSEGLNEQLDSAYEDTMAMDMDDRERKKAESDYQKNKDNLSDFTNGKKSPIIYPQFGFSVFVRSRHASLGFEFHVPVFPTGLVGNELKMWGLGGSVILHIRR